MISWQGSGSFKATKVQKQTFMCGRRESAKLVTCNEHVSHAHAIQGGNQEASIQIGSRELSLCHSKFYYESISFLVDEMSYDK